MSALRQAQRIQSLQRVSKDTEVIEAASLYLRSYSFDCIFAAVHFCFSGYFCGSKRSMLSFIHNITSIILVRIPGAVLASVFYPETLYPMGWAAPLGSLLSALICVCFYISAHQKVFSRSIFFKKGCRGGLGASSTPTVIDRENNKKSKRIIKARSAKM